jgi:HEAT repeat protein
MANKEGLIQDLTNDDWFVRLKAAKTLGKLGDASAVPALAAALPDRHPEVCVYLFDALASIGAPAVPALVYVLKKDTDTRLRLLAVQALGGVAEASAVPALLKFINDESQQVRYEIAYALGQIGDVSAVPALLELLNDASGLVRFHAETALKQIEGRQPQ